MRMWMVPPREMCQQHLFGEHLELHMLVGTIARGFSIEGYLEAGLCEPESIISRHDAIANEMLRRGYAHRSPIHAVQLPIELAWMGVRIDREAAHAELVRRCPKCAAMKGEPSG